MWKILLLLALPCAAVAGPFAGDESDIFVLGEVHDNPAHHAFQAEAVADIAPKAVVFEMLTDVQAAKVTPDLLADPVALGRALDWAESGWPDFEMYYPIFAAANDAQIIGAAVPRDETRRAMEVGVAVSFGAGADAYGLTEALPTDQLADRLNLQLDAHCGMLPTDLLPSMVDLQRLRDATLARAAVDAVAQTGGPVVVITGNGHARTDWGVPAYIARVAPKLRVVALGQSEDAGAPDGAFDIFSDAPAVERDDPCKAFE